MCIFRWTALCSSNQTPTVSQSVSQLCGWGGGLVDEPFVWAKKPQTQQWSAPAPYKGPRHTGTHTGTMGRAQGGGWNGWAEVAHLHTSRQPIPSYPPPNPPSFKDCCRCLPVFVAQRGSREACAVKTFWLLQLKTCRDTNRVQQNVTTSIWPKVQVKVKMKKQIKINN